MDTTNYEDKILNSIKLPIEYTDFKYLNKNVISDLELDVSNNAYTILFDTSSNGLQSITEKKWKNYYSSDTKFLKNKQNFIKSIKKKDFCKMQNVSKEINNYFNKWKRIKSYTEIDFLNKFQFIDWKHLKFLNKQSIFLQAMAFYNITSPLIHILLPIFLLIIPFFMIKLVMQIPFSFETYKSLLSKSFQNHSFGKMFNAFCSPNCYNLDMNTKVYAAVSFALYIFTFYQNILGCISYYKNICFIQEFLYDTKQFISNCNTLSNFVSSTIKNKYFKEFNKASELRLIHINEFGENINFLENSKFSFKNIVDVGNLMYNFQELFSSEYLEETFCYWFGFCGFLDNMFGIVKRIKKGELNFTKFTKKNNVLNMNKLFYIYHISNSNEKIVKNDINIKKNIIITGPNASGKTTMLKSTLMNIILSQQFGAGCFETCTMKPYKYVESYINIPDTCERDSLFQAEAKRCLHIIKNIKNNRIFCIFDELFSGTNPYEAQKSAISYLNYLHKYNVTYMLTTHFNELKKIENNFVSQYNMLVKHNNNKHIFTYKIKKGVSNTYGGFKVLKDIGFPTEITSSLE